MRSRPDVRAGSLTCRPVAGIDERAGSRVHYDDQIVKMMLPERPPLRIAGVGRQSVPVLVWIGRAQGEHVGGFAEFFLVLYLAIVHVTHHRETKAGLGGSEKKLTITTSRLAS